MNIGHHAPIRSSNEAYHLSPIPKTSLPPPPTSDDKPELCQTVERARQDLVIIYNFPLGRPSFPSTLLFPRFERIAFFQAAFLLVHLRGDEETNRRGRKEARKKEGNEKRRNERKKKKKKERKNGRPRGPVRPRKWKRRREMAVSIIPETMTDRHRYSAGNPRASATKTGTLLHLESIYQRTRRP